ncbi:hypothetical protein GN956_G12928, partial [Arapaima gigas]
ACVGPRPAMEPWPPAAWVLLLSLITDWSKSAQSRDFTVKDIIFLHPSTTPYPGGFKCFTCENAVDNYNCNRWAPDVYCPRETRYCYTKHEMDESGSSVSVTKRCVALQDCLSTGCSELAQQGHKVCTSCCEGNICNLPLPTNQTDAVLTTLSPLSGSPQPSPGPPSLTAFLSFLVILVSSRVIQGVVFLLAASVQLLLKRLHRCGAAVCLGSRPADERRRFLRPGFSQEIAPSRQPGGEDCQTEPGENLSGGRLPLRRVTVVKVSRFQQPEWTDQCKQRQQPGQRAHSPGRPPQVTAEEKQGSSRP